MSEDCLYDRPSGELPEDCSEDPYAIGAEPAVGQAIRALGLDPAQVSFAGCQGDRFATRVIRGDSRPYLYRILYPLAETYQFVDYTGPITHELAHAQQLEAFGSVCALRRHFNPNRLGTNPDCNNIGADRIELGADFVVGLVFRRHLSLNQGIYLRGLALFGNYRTGGEASHSSPEGRTSAFRIGYHFEPRNWVLSQAIAEFQDERYARIRHGLVR